MSLPKSLTEYRRMVDKIKDKGLMSKRMDRVEEMLSSFKPLMDIATGAEISDTERDVSFDLTAPVIINKVLFEYDTSYPDGIVDYPDDYFPKPGIEFTSVGGTIRLNSLEATHCFNNLIDVLWDLESYSKAFRTCKGSRFKQWRPKDPLNVPKGEVMVGSTKRVKVKDSADMRWGTYASDMRSRWVVHKESQTLAPALWEGWGGGNVIVLTNPLEFVAKFKEMAQQVRDEAHELSRQIRR